MTSVLITSRTVTENGTHVEATSGNKSASVWVSASGYVTVCCLNASHRAWRGAGRTFSSAADAAGAYKSAEMRAIISCAVGV